MSKTKKVESKEVKQRKIIFKNHQSPGDLVMLTAAVRDLKKAHPEILVGVDTSCGALWENNPYITNLEAKDPEVEVFKLDYPLIHHSNEGQYHFIHGFRKEMEEKLQIRIPATKFKGDIHIGEDEKGWISQVEEMGITDKFWLIFGGGKYDFTAKWWNPSYYQKVVDYFKGRITFVQVGDKSHWHPPLRNVISLVGKTDMRQLIRLVYHSVGVICPVTFGMHAAAAIEMKHQPPMNRPCVVISGGREPVQWEAYPHHRFLAVNGSMKCCDNGGCWKSRCQKVGDGDSKDENDLCEVPVQVKKDLVIPKCMMMIKPRDVIRAIEQYYEGGLLKYGSSL